MPSPYYPPPDPGTGRVWTALYLAFRTMKALLALSVALALGAAACTLEVEGPGWENEAPADFAAIERSGSGGGISETVSLPSGVLAFCYRATGGGDGIFEADLVPAGGTFSESVPIPISADGLGSSNGYQAFEAAEAGGFTLTATASDGVDWDLAVTLPVNKCPWDD